MRSPSRRDVLAASGGLLAGLAGGYVARPRLETDSPPAPAPLAWADTEWPYPDYDPQRTRNPPPESAPDGEFDEQWRQSLERVFERALPVASNGSVYTASTDARHARLDAFALHDGERDWKHESTAETSTRRPRVLAPGDGAYYRFVRTQTAPLGLAAAQSGEVAWHVSDPPRGGWTVGAGRLYYGNRSAGKLHVYDARTGENLWTTRVDDERLVVRSFHPRHGVFATSHGTLYALDPADGSTRWDYRVDHHVQNGPIVTHERAFVGTWNSDKRRVAALDAAAGEHLWTYPRSPAMVESKEESTVYWFEVGAAAGGTLLVNEYRVDSRPDALHAVDVASGDRRWRVEPPEGAKGLSKPTVVDREVFVCTTNDRTALSVLDLQDGSVKRSRPLPGYCPSPVVTDGKIFLQLSEELLAFA
ncbi:PQQ repeat protein [Halobacterium hubeiense]|uniref:PQQ repeat protein n=1 Tax=Halobacterium hubeiense TaxID=1407499 RepID=A0A0U5H2T5_9EURY|nr:PQQ-binding-like beta-propeller repeat protein [Halobacterium hubeiense]CQH60695.1 PQQ repeat protein [Halobacterium hubeiense]